MHPLGDAIERNLAPLEILKRIVLLSWTASACSEPPYVDRINFALCQQIAGAEDGNIGFGERHRGIAHLNPAAEGRTKRVAEKPLDFSADSGERYPVALRGTDFPPAEDIPASGK